MEDLSDVFADLWRQLMGAWCHTAALQMSQVFHQAGWRLHCTALQGVRALCDICHAGRICFLGLQTWHRLVSDLTRPEPLDLGFWQEPLTCLHDPCLDWSLLMPLVKLERLDCLCKLHNSSVNVIKSSNQLIQRQTLCSQPRRQLKGQFERINVYGDFASENDLKAM